jgi:hypothetical protein
MNQNVPRQSRSLLAAFALQQQCANTLLIYNSQQAAAIWQSRCGRRKSCVHTFVSDTADGGAGSQRKLCAARKNV